MAKRDDITATEKLLDLIRNSSPARPGEPVPEPAAPEATEPEPAAPEATEPEPAAPEPVPEPAPEPPAEPDTAPGTPPREGSTDTGPPPLPAATPADGPSPAAPEPAAPEPAAPEPPVLELELESGQEDESPLSLEEPAEAVRDGDLLRPGGGTAAIPPPRPRKSSRRASTLLRFGRRRLMLAIHADNDWLDLALLARQGGRFALQDFRSANRPQDADTTAWHLETLGRLAGEMLPGHRRLPASLVLASTTRVIYHLLPTVPPEQQANAIYWAIKKAQELDDTTTIFDYQVVGDLKIKDQERTLYRVTLGDRDTIGRWHEACEKYRLDLELATTPPQALHGLIRHCGLPAADTPAAFLCIGDNHSLILAYHQQQLIFSRTINTGLAALDEEGFERLQQGRAATLDEAFSTSRCQPAAVSRLLRQVQRTLDYCTTTYEMPAVEEVYILGLPAASPAFLDHCAAELQTTCRQLDPIALGAVAGGTLLSGDAPALVHRRGRLLGVLGSATLNPHADQNFLFTYRDRDEQHRARRVSQGILAGFALLFAGLVATNALFSRQNEKLAAELRVLRQEIAASKELIGSSDPQAALLATIGEIRKRRLAAEAHAHRHLPLALIDAVAAALPATAQVTSIEYQQEAAAGKEKEERHLLRLGVILTAPRNRQEVALAALLKRLASDPLLAGRPRVRTRKEVPAAPGEGQALFAIVEFSVPAALLAPEPAAKEGA